MQVLTAAWCMHARRMPVWTGIQYLFFWFTSLAWIFGQLAVGQVANCCTQCKTGYVLQNSVQTSINCLIPGRTGRASWRDCTVDCVDELNSVLYDTYCNICQGNNQYKDRNNCQSDCKACPSGKVGSGTPDDLCQTCQPGTYVYNYGCTPCPKGTAQSLTHQTSCGTCTNSYSPSEGATKCRDYSFCQAGQYMTRDGTPSSNRECAWCPAGKYNEYKNVDTECFTCPDGKFQSFEGLTFCYDFIPCAPGEKTISVGSKIQDYVCEACPSPWTTLLGSETTCTSCVAGKYKDTTVNPATCTTCACTGGGERYILCPAGSTRKECPYCTGTQPMGFCDAGKQPSYRCDGRGAADAECVACPAGSHKPNRDQQWCDQCPTGFYKPAPASTNNCEACTNRNPTNQNLAFYTAWTASPATNTCPWYVWFGAACYGTCRD